MVNARQLIQRRFPGLTAKRIGAYTASFLLWHELTAILPLPAFYAVLCHPSMDKQLDSILDRMGVEEASFQRAYRAMEKMIVGEEKKDLVWHGPDNKIVFRCAVAYMAVKVLMPVRIAVSLFLTPRTARYLERFSWTFKK